MLDYPSCEQLQHADTPTARESRANLMTEDEKAQRIHEALCRVDDIHNGYLYSFTAIIYALEPVNDKLNELMSLLSCIIEEGNTLEPEGGNANQGSSNQRDNTMVNTEHQENATHADSIVEGGFDIVPPYIFSDDPFNRPPTPRHPNTPTWKYMMRHRNIDELYVGQAELDVFNDALDLTRSVHQTLLKVVELCEKFHRQAAQKQVTWNKWNDFLEAYRAKKRGNNVEKSGW